MLLETPLCHFGWQAVDFTLPDLDGSPRSLADLKGPNGLLIAFICNHCPYVKAMLERFVADARKLQAAGIGVAAIMANDYRHYPEDAPDKMVAFAHQHGFTFPYLLDESQQVARAYGAVCTPDFFGFNRDLELQYRGRIDEAPRDPANSGRRELLEAMLQVAQTGQGPKEQQASMGCSIKWKD